MQSNKKIPVLVVCEGLEYKRFVGRNMTDHVVSDRPLTAEVVEALRVSPQLVIQPNEAA